MQSRKQRAFRKRRKQQAYRKRRKLRACRKNRKQNRKRWTLRLWCSNRTD
jgi:hypothetical protein